MITGRGTLKIGGVPLDVSFTVPEGPCGAEALLPEVQRFANQLTDHAVSKVEQAGLKVSCTKGCGACCRQMVPISPTEARGLARLVDTMPPDRAAAVRSRFEAARVRMSEAALVPNGHPDKDKAAYREYGLAYFKQAVPCPLLENESCSIHPDRPLVCREYLVTSPPEGCAALGSGQVRQVPVPLRVWAAFGRSVSPSRTLEWMPLIDALEFSKVPADSSLHLTGPKRLEALLREIQS